MKPIAIITAILVGVSASLPQVSHGIVKEGLTIDSRILHKKVRYTVYLPFDYQTSTRYYPVVYLLHGYTDNDMGWIQFGEANLILDEAIGKQEITPMILVMPDGGVSWYINNFDSTVNYEDFFFKEFVPAIESQYRIRAEKRYRGVAGLSMGGFGTLVYAMRHPDMFASCAALSAAIMTDDEISGMDSTAWNRWPVTLYGQHSGTERLTPHLNSYNPISIAGTADPEKLRSTRIYIDCGDDDYLTTGNATLHIVLTRRRIPHEYRSRDGMHQWSYWRSGLPDALKFIGTGFHQP